MAQRRILEQIGRLDPEKDHLQIMQLSALYDFPFEVSRSGEFAMVRTFCVPSISSLLYKTGELFHRSQKRFDDTDLILSEVLEHGYDSERGRAAIARMNRMHERFAIANDGGRLAAACRSARFRLRTPTLSGLPATSKPGASATRPRTRN